MQINMVLIFVLMMVGFGLLVTIYFWPSVALGIFIAIPLVKPAMVMRFPFFRGTFGYIFDTSIVIIAMLALVIYLMKTGQGIRLLIPKSFWLCWFVLSVLVWMLLPASRDTVTGFQKAMLFSVYSTLVILLGALCGSSTESASFHPCVNRSAVHQSL